jgi:hypothetical protein
VNKGSKCASAPRLELMPESLDAGVQLVWNLLEGLVCLPRHHLQARVRDSHGDRSTHAWRHYEVEFAGQHERRSRGLLKAMLCIMPEADVDLRLKGLDGLLVGEGQRLLDELSEMGTRDSSRLAQRQRRRP